MKNNREKLQFHNIPYITPMLLLVLFITGLLGMSCRVQCAAAPTLRIMRGYGDLALSDYSLCKEFTASDFSEDRIFTNSRRKIYFTGDHFVLSFAHGITAGAILEGCGIEPAQVEAIYFGDSLRFTMEELNGEADEVRQNIPEASSIVSYGPGGELTAGEYLVSYWEEDLLALFSDNYDYAIGETMDAYYDSSLIGRKWGDFYYMTQDQNQVETSLRRGLTFYYGQLDPLDVNLPVEGIHTVYIQMKKEVSDGPSDGDSSDGGSGSGSSDGNGSGDSSGGGSSDGNGSGSGSSGSGSSGNESSGNNSTGSNSSGSSRTGANNKGSKKTLKNTDGSNNKKANSGRAGSSKSKSNNNSSGSGKNSAAKTSDTTTSAAERSAAESSTAEMTDKKETNNSNDTGTDAAGYRKDNSENEDEDPDQDQENEAKETPSQKTDSPGVLRLKDAGSNIEAKAASDMQADSKVLYGTALLVLLGIAAGLVGFRRQMRQSGESGYGRK